MTFKPIEGDPTFSEAKNPGKNSRVGGKEGKEKDKLTVNPRKRGGRLLCRKSPGAASALRQDRKKAQSTAPIKESKIEDRSRPIIGEGASIARTRRHSRHRTEKHSFTGKLRPETYKNRMVKRKGDVRRTKRENLGTRELLFSGEKNSSVSTLMFYEVPPPASCTRRYARDEGFNDLCGRARGRNGQVRKPLEHGVQKKFSLRLTGRS